MIKNAHYQADNFANFSEKLLSENQLFGISAGSDLLAINIAAIKKIVVFHCSFIELNISFS